jgi:hypothetical protein
MRAEAEEATAAPAGAAGDAGAGAAELREFLRVPGDGEVGNPGFRPGEGPVYARRVGLAHPLFRAEWGFVCFCVPASAGDPERQIRTRCAADRNDVLWVAPPRGEALAHSLIKAEDFARTLGTTMSVVCLDRGVVRLSGPGEKGDVEMFVRVARIRGACPG